MKSRRNVVFIGYLTESYVYNVNKLEYGLTVENFLIILCTEMKPEHDLILK